MRAIDPAARSRRAFTLIESLVASVVLAVCVVGVSSMLVAVSQNTRSSEATLLAASRSQTNLEGVAALRLNDYSAAAGTGSSEAIDASHFAVTSDGYATTTGRVSYVSRAALQPAREVAVVSITTTTPGGGRVTLYRAVTRAEMIR